jgi:hypothetical protein
MLMKTRPHLCGLRDRDYLLDVEVAKLKKLYPNYFILEYYCFENYLFHPDNLESINQTLKLDGFSKPVYVNEIIEQKNSNKTKIILNLKKSRDSYQEFRIDAEKVRAKDKEDEIISNLESDNVEVFFKSFSMKDYYDKKYISRYGLKYNELADTKWFRNRMIKLLEI